jgi:hypothetical protein
VYPDEAVILWFAVLERAVLDLDMPKEREDATRWFISNIYDIGSFLFICDMFDIDPKVIRQLLRKKIYYQFITHV